MKRYFPIPLEDFKKYNIVRTSPYGPRGSKFHAGEDWAPTILSWNIRLIAPEAGRVVYGQDLAGAKYAYIYGNSGWGYLLLHAHSFIGSARKVKAGEAVAYMGNTGYVLPKPDAKHPYNGLHLHFTPRTNAYNSSTHINPDSVKWSYYNYDEYEMVRLQKVRPVITTNTIDMNWRKTPSLLAPVIGKVKPKTRFNTRVFARGTKINNIDTWYKYGKGFVSGAFCKEL